jgi:SRSO17 transposase
MSKTTNKPVKADPKAPPSGQGPSQNLARRDLKNLAAELSQYSAEYAPLFKRREQREWAQLYLRGQLSELERKSIEPMVLRERGEDINAVRAVQQFIGEGAWDDDRILEQHQQLVAQDLGEADGVMIVDGSGLPKKGDHSVGVKRQYCGALGKLANCQQGVFLVYASRLGHTFVDRRLYLPQEWFDEAHASKRQRCGVPKGLKFKTEPQLGLEMVTNLAEQDRVAFRWVTCDEHYGINTAFLDGVARLDKWYFAEVPANTAVWVGSVQILPPGKGQQGNLKTGRPRTGPRVARDEAAAQQVRLIAANLSPEDWQRRTIKEGSKGPITADFAFVPAISNRRGRPGHQVWVIFRRSRSNPSEIKYYLSNAPATTAKTELVRMAGLRWPVETAIEEAKSELGMDHYETRTWLGWHHHMTLTFLAHHFLVRLRLRLKKVPSSDPGTKQSADSERARVTGTQSPARA